jgi:hypothetical protein
MKQILLSLSTVIFFNSVFSQPNNKPYIKGYKDYKECLFFDSIGRLNVKNIGDLESMYECFISFRVDTNSNIINFHILEIPVFKHSAKVTSYIEKMVKASNGLWVSQIQEGHKVKSDEIVYRVDIMKKDQSMKEREIENRKTMKYYYEEGGFQQEVIKKFFQSEARTIIIEY